MVVAELYLCPCAIYCTVTIVTMEPCKVYGRNLYHQNGRETLDKMTQKPYLYNIHSGQFSKVEVNVERPNSENMHIKS